MSVRVNGKEYYRTAEVCRMLGVSRNTLYRWLQHGVLGQYEHRDWRGWRIITQHEIDTLKSETGRISIINRIG